MHALTCFNRIAGLQGLLLRQPASRLAASWPMLRDEGLLRDLSAPGLLCPRCEIQKLSADFPAPSQLPKDGLTEAERRFCCQCLKEKAGAIAKADPSNPATRILEQLKGAERASKFKVLSEVNVNQSQGELNQVKVVRVTGAFSMVPAAPGMSVAEFKKRVQAAMAVAPGRQRLVFKVRRSKSTSSAAVVVPCTASYSSVAPVP